MTATTSAMALASLTLIVASGPSRGAAAASRLSPAALAIYYGYPSLINGASGNVDRAVAAFADYDVLVLGDGLQFADLDARRRPAGAGPDEHRRTRAIIERLRARSASMQVYGYVDLGNTQDLAIDEIGRRARLWWEMGVTGVFLDEAGYDFGVTRERQNAAIDAIHGLGLSAFVNAFNPDDVFNPSPVPLNAVGGGNPSGLATRLGARDAYLLESFQVRLGQPETWAAWSSRTRKAIAYRDRYHTRMFGVATTTADTESQAAGLFPYVWWSAALWGLDGIGWGEPDFSGSSSRLSPRHRTIDRQLLAGARFVSDVTATPEGFERRTDAGRIVVSRTGRWGRFVR